MIDVPYAVRDLLVPSLLLQPLVENAIKHGIAPRKAGGTVAVEARLAPGVSDESGMTDRLHLWVRDTGAGASENEVVRGRARGVGLSNLERRLRCIYSGTASIRLTSAPGAGTTVEIQLPINIQNGSATETTRAATLSEDSRHER